MGSRTGGRTNRVQRVVKRLTSKYRGKFAAIDPRTGEYFLGDDPLEVLLRARSSLPRTIFEFKRLGSPFAFSARLTLS